MLIESLLLIATTSSIGFLMFLDQTLKIEHDDQVLDQDSWSEKKLKT